MAERRIQYEHLEHKPDSGFKVVAPSLERLYIDAALALTDQMVTLDQIKEDSKQVVTITAPDKEALLVRWLNEILFLFEKHKFLARRITFQSFDGKSIQATLIGDTYEPTRHGHVSEIKAVTYHQLKVGHSDTENFFAQVFLDL